MNNNILYEICAAIIALSFLGLVIYFIITLVALRKLLKSLTKVTEQVHKSLECLGKGGERLLDKSQEVVDSVKSSVKNMTSLSGWFGSFFKKESHLEEEAEKVDEAVKGLHGCHLHSHQKEECDPNYDSEKDLNRLEKHKHILYLVEEIVEYVTFGYVVFNRIKKIRDEMRR